MANPTMWSQKGITILVDQNPPLRHLLRDPIMLLGFGFGSGLSPLMPGTAGTLAAIPIYYLLLFIPWWGYLAAVVVALILGIYICGITTRKLGVHDHGGIVWDEFVGFWITMIGAPAGWIWVLLGFLLFRVFDMVKPWPIRWLDRNVHGGFGIMLDDVAAGCAAAVCLQFSYYVYLLSVA